MTSMFSGGDIIKIELFGHVMLMQLIDQYISPSKKEVEIWICMHLNDGVNHTLFFDERDKDRIIA